MRIRDLGIVGYKDAIDLQENVLRRRIENEISDTLILLEHDPVLTLGRMESEASIIDRAFFDKKNIPVIFSDRGGKITYHAPGQLVIYPIVDLREKKRDVSRYIDFLEKTMVRAFDGLGVAAERIADRRGVWIGGKKIAFIGVGVRKWVTFHGACININNDIAPFSRIHPCGEDWIKVTSVREILGRAIEMDMAKKVFADQFIKDLEAEYGIKNAGNI